MNKSEEQQKGSRGGMFCGHSERMNPFRGTVCPLRGVGYLRVLPAAVIESLSET